ncbi:exopolysaccharide biosynthesis polyprenyl glycosylphosphotransferase [Aquiflexum gelatinilyticum]|uniref:Exopolysaccharide biosynthesis polyprenyl glycosylphosphotransferase n=1 Tax=Aquiflexum gelatinilyticum TaxID=2961943 RepID=A0A9X2T3C8_9BACT|nr:exopolysaccharide biosynthesis polyprenyl glycosylphosphotransferase [Aquiflexum gelatinilyticum]MCR9016235.1 exopolysaccharide biosynthesis polyprenyl glycosylphosphotransferase [Aquiflexum gelatinilyticum]MCS4435672.1 exopolysaccharide biosynthesis polyprenyl glycosylphosphotransferase [Aquiflexum gelatinilyticum]
MKKRFYKYFPWLFVLGDILTVSFSFFISNKVFQPFEEFKGLDFPTFPAFIMIWMVITILKEDFKIGRTNEADQTFKKLIGSLAWFLVIISMIWMPFHDNSLRLLSFLSLAASLLVFLGIYRVGVHLILRKYRETGHNYRRAVILGMGGTSDQLAQVFKLRRDFGIKFLGYYDDKDVSGQTRGNIKKFFEEAVDLNIDQIYISEHLEEKKVKKVINFADEHYIKVKVIPGGSLQLEKNLSFSKYGDFFVINVNEIPLDNAFNRVFKRAFDIVFSAFVLVFILSWLIPLVGLLIKLESKGPVFFIQERNGENNKVFMCLKFRSMTPNDYADTHQAVKNDPRITRIGSFLRMTSLDEMPQFINVLLGDMSIVGPRPHTIPMNQVFKTQIEKYNSRHKIKPGITGLAQVKGYRGEIENPYQIRSRVKLDYFYIQNWSILLDLKICILTVYELVVNRENAY